MKRILVTGSRNWKDWPGLCRALNKESFDCRRGAVAVIHGAAQGADSMAQEWADFFGAHPEPYPAEDFPTPLIRNQHMVDLGADVCLAFATKWASGTGHCARRARKAGIPVIDYGVDTSIEARP